MPVIVQDSPSLISANWPRAICVLCLVATGCVPAISGFQSARLVPEGKSDITPVYSAVFQREGAYSTKRTEFAYHAVGVRVASRLSENRDFQMGVARVLRLDSKEGGNVVMFSVKRRFVPDRFAVALPIGASFNQHGFGAVAMQPTGVVSIPVADRIDVNASLSAIVSLWPRRRSYGNFALGLSFFDRNDAILIQPEIGLMETGSRSLYLTAGLSVTIRRPVREREAKK